MIDVTGWPVNRNRCKTCPFGGKDGMDRDPELATTVRLRVMKGRQQICHHPRLHGNKETHLCRGARDFQLQIFYRLGYIDSETDEAFEAELRKASTKPNTNKKDNK